MQYPSTTVRGTPPIQHPPGGGLDKLSLRAGRQNQINDMNFLFKDINAGPPSDDSVWPAAASTSGGCNLLTKWRLGLPKNIQIGIPSVLCANKQETEMRQRFWLLASSRIFIKPSGLSGWVPQTCTYIYTNVALVSHFVLRINIYLAEKLSKIVLKDFGQYSGILRGDSLCECAKDGCKGQLDKYQDTHTHCLSLYPFLIPFWR